MIAAARGRFGGGMASCLVLAIAGCGRESEKAAAPPADPWSWSVEETAGRLSLILRERGEAAFAFGLGSGGVVSDIIDVRGGLRPLLSPSWQGERTDRVMQWTLWSESIRHPVEALPEFEWRFNVTQAGCFDGTLSPTVAVGIDRPGRRVDVYAVPQDQWKTEQREAMQGRLSCLTRYEMLGDGVLRISRWARLGEATVEGSPASFSRIYFEAWSPFLRGEEGFDTLALALNLKGEPRKRVSVEMFQSKPSIPVSETPGYAVVCRFEDSVRHPAIGLVFGQAAPEGGGHKLNLMRWGSGYGILPALVAGDLPTGTVLEHHLALVARAGTGKAFRQTLDRAAAALPPPRILRPGDPVPEELRSLLARLAANVSATGVRTSELGTLTRQDR